MACGKIFGLLIYKNMIVRKRHWRMTIFLQALVPIALFALLQAVRDFSVQSPVEVKENTYYPVHTQDDLMKKINNALNKVYYTPKNEDTYKMMESVRYCLKLLPDNMIGFANETEMVDAYTIYQAKNPIVSTVAVVFEQYNKPAIKYKIRHSWKIPNNLYQTVADGERMSSSPSIYFEIIPFTQVQICLDETLIKQAVPDSDIKMSIQRMPYPPYVKIDDADVFLREGICTFAVIAFVIPLCIEASYASKEKFIGVTVLMTMNGVKLAYNLFSWLITGLLVSTVYIIPAIILFKNTFSQNVEAYLQYSNGFIFWLLFTTHVAHLITFGMHIAAYFSKPRFVITALAIIYVAAISLHENMVKEEVFSVIPYFGILFPNIMLFRLFEETNAHESKLIGIQWSTLFVPGKTEYGILGSPGFIFFFSILGAVIHFTLAVYINAILPGKYGVRKNPLYFLKCIKKNKIALDEEAGEFDYDKVNEDFEPVISGTLTPGIQIRDLKKSYTTSWIRKSKVHALKGISIDFYKGQITALLGHNGAGKTTLMSILTGVTSETQGKVFINGRNIRKDLDSIRNNLGLCPQENMVFPDLNVFEQIEFFGLLKAKNKTRNEIKENVNTLLSKLKLSEKKDFLPSKLSGGQQRRLCLGMALIGDANIIILDEPTSGMDPETRRDTWDIILKLRGEKTILISTHNMEEADILGDRIAIVHAGRLRSYGTAMFLKKQYGHGHIEVTLSTKSWCVPEKVISKFDERTQQLSIDSEKIVLNVPHTDSLPQSLDKVESEKKNLGVTGISVSLITLEQVFLKIVKNEDSGKHLNELFTAPLQKITGNELCMQSILALFCKKFTYTIKNLTNLLMILILPNLSVLLLALSYNLPSDSTDIVPLKLDMYRYSKALYSSNDELIGQKYRDVVQYFGKAERVASDTSVASALLNSSMQNIVEYRNNFIVSAEFNDTEGNTTWANGFYSGLAIHSVPLTVNLLSNSFIKALAGDQYSIVASRQQLPNTLSSTMIQLPEAESLSRVLMFCSFFFPTVALFVAHPLEETMTKVKQLQRMTGVTSLSYWSTMFAFDFLIYTLSVLLITLALYIMDIILDIRLYYGIEISCTILILELFGINVLLFIYLFSFMNKSKNTITTILSLAPLGCVIIQYLLHEVIHSFDWLNPLHILQKRIFRLLPYVSLFHGQYSFFNIAVQNARCRRLPNRLHAVVCFAARDPCCGLDCEDGVCKNQLSYFKDFTDDMNFEESIVYLAITPILYFALLIVLEKKLFSKLFMKIVGTKLRKEQEIMDDQVKMEKLAVAMEINKINSQGVKDTEEELRRGSGETTNIELLHSPISEGNSLFLVYELSKYYGKLMAVKEISFRVKPRECFGLLGVNGAGKSTTFRMLTGEEMSNSGIMYLGQAEIHSDRTKYLSEMGYCPQTDALIPSLNTFDHLRLFARLRGIPKCNVELEVNKWINRLNLTACMKQPSGTYSGGNKRRLNIAMALIGNPTLVLLDEPTTGVDPAARRSLWNTLQACQAAGQAIILTSHSMEECEALCNRLVIMVKGELVCIGASQELKQRFGAGYDIHIKLNPGRTDEDVNNIKKVIESSLTCDIRDENLGFLAYHVTDCNTTWEKMYDTVKTLKQRYSCIEDYAVLSATLEQLFIQFARGAEMIESDESHITSQV
ncbi:phospholipid-transporting ATPase ABCA1 [Monomorium pharaonis]|uniref:phospholipid-transporting ATPase ABCA1 n=1 Tax=Monomorium pharaonis TaxID=307658 RepID=UPI00063F5DBA|nr:phospholipid-transporting ATPase ABCA1 [Monomorium pharaonis]